MHEDDGMEAQIIEKPVVKDDRISIDQWDNEADIIEQIETIQHNMRKSEESAYIFNNLVKKIENK